LSQIVAEIHRVGRLAMADCAEASDGRTARELGVEVLGSTMSGYLGEAIPEGPDLNLVAALAKLGGFVIAEGRYHIPALAARAIATGADAVVAGSAITRPEHITRWFVDALATAQSRDG
jgi:N-acylglucosamine-6-phosphate 2-epimerase